MTLVTVWSENDAASPTVRTTEVPEIATVLDSVGVRFERWPTQTPPGGWQDPQAVLTAYQDRIAAESARSGYVLVDVVSLRPTDDPTWPETAATARARFLDEHTHDDDEIRFFAEGTGVFYLHLEKRVYAVLCEAGDLLAVPRGTTHWFDMGERPSFTAVRFFATDDGWVGTFTGSDIASRFPGHDALLASLVGS